MNDFNFCILTLVSAVTVQNVAFGLDIVPKTQVEKYGGNIDFNTKEIILCVCILITIALVLCTCLFLDCRKESNSASPEEPKNQEEKELSFTIDIYKEIQPAPRETDKVLKYNATPYGKGRVKSSSASFVDDIMKSAYSKKGRKGGHAISTPKTVSSNQSSSYYIQRIEHLRTKLVARYSSASSGDYSKLDTWDIEAGPCDVGTGKSSESEPHSKGHPTIPTIVVEFVE